MRYGDEPEMLAYVTGEILVSFEPAANDLESLLVSKAWEYASRVGVRLDDMCGEILRVSAPRSMDWCRAEVRGFTRPASHW